MGNQSGYEALRTKALEKATLQIDDLPLVGRKYDENQTLAFPRYKDYGFRVDYFAQTTTGISVPVDVERATYIQAKYLLDSRTNCTIKALEMGITNVTIGRTSQTVDMSLSPVNLQWGLCREAMKLLQKFLVVTI
jgi:hypothetical protein